MRLIIPILVSLAVLVGGFVQSKGRAQADTTIRVNVEGRGTIVIKLFTKEAPRACNRILDLVRQGFYDGQRFFRVTRSPRPFIAQAGDPATRNGVDGPDIGKGGSGTAVRIPYEDSGHSNDKYAVGLAALVTKDRDSGDSQFYIVLGDGNNFLDGSYTVFGTVTDGKDVVDHLEKGDRITSITVG